MGCIIGRIRIGLRRSWRSRRWCWSSGRRSGMIFRIIFLFFNVLPFVQSRFLLSTPSFCIILIHRIFRVILLIFRSRRSWRGSRCGSRRCGSRVGVIFNNWRRTKLFISHDFIYIMTRHSPLNHGFIAEIPAYYW